MTAPGPLAAMAARWRSLADVLDRDAKRHPRLSADDLALRADARRARYCAAEVEDVLAGAPGVDRPVAGLPGRFPGRKRRPRT